MNATTTQNIPIFNHTEHRKSWQHVIDTLSFYTENNVYSIFTDIDETNQDNPIATNISDILDYYFLHISTCQDIRRINPACDYAREAFDRANGVKYYNQPVIKGNYFCGFCPLNFHDYCGFYSLDIHQPETQICYSNLTARCMIIYDSSYRVVIHRLQNIYSEVANHTISANIALNSSIGTINTFFRSITMVIRYAEQIRDIPVKPSVVAR